MNGGIGVGGEFWDQGVQGKGEGCGRERRVQGRLEV